MVLIRQEGIRSVTEGYDISVLLTVGALSQQSAYSILRDSAKDSSNLSDIFIRYLRRFHIRSGALRGSHSVLAHHALQRADYELLLGEHRVESIEEPGQEDERLVDQSGEQ